MLTLWISFVSSGMENTSFVGKECLAIFTNGELLRVQRCESNAIWILMFPGFPEAAQPAATLSLIVAGNMKDFKHVL